jgi:putative transposase
MQPGGTFFFTVNLQNRQLSLLTEHIDRLRTAVRTIRNDRPFTVVASVILPEYLHMIWTLPAGDGDFSTRWRLIKSHFSAGLSTPNPRRPSQQRKNEKGIWQRRFYDHLIRDEDELAALIDYVHFNPVKHGRVDRPADWPYSSIHRFIERGELNADWGTDGLQRDFDLD